MGNRLSRVDKQTTGFIRLNTETGQRVFSSYVDLACRSLGGRIADVSDEFFAMADNLLQPGDAISKPNTYTENGAWMDGWETRRHNPDHDWVIIKLGFAGSIAGFNIDTGHFNGNHAPEAAVDACFIDEETLKQGGDIEFPWEEILPKVSLDPASKHYFMFDVPTGVCNFVRLRIFPDGGVARFRVYGTVRPIWPIASGKQLVDLAFVGMGGRVISCSDQHYTPASNLILPGRGQNMGDGWETKRSREPNHHDWVLIRLGNAGRLEKCEVDTHYFKGNYPESVMLEACYSEHDDPTYDVECAWFQILPKQRLNPHQQHHFSLDLRDRVFTHVRMNIYPDGGVMRLRVYGRPVFEDDLIGSVEAEETKASLAESPVQERRVSRGTTPNAPSSPAAASSSAVAAATTTTTTTKTTTATVTVIEQQQQETATQSVPASASSKAASARAGQRRKSRRAAQEAEEEEEYVEPTVEQTPSTRATRSTRVVTRSTRKRGRKTASTEDA
jgi:allantoicase